MRDESVARNYAETLITLAERHGTAESYGQWIDAVAELVQSQPRLRTFLETPRIDARAKKEALVRALGTEVPRPFLNFLLITIDKRRQRLIGQIAHEYRTLLNERLGRTLVEITVARPLDEASLARVSEQLSRMLGKTAVPSVRVRPEILGGIVVKSQDTIWDGSVRNRLERLRRRLLQAELPDASASGGEGSSGTDGPTLESAH